MQTRPNSQYRPACLRRSARQAGDGQSVGADDDIESPLPPSEQPVHLCTTQTMWELIVANVQLPERVRRLISPKGSTSRYAVERPLCRQGTT